MEGSIIQGKTSENSCVLPIFFPPPVKLYLHHAIPLALILTNPDTLDWFYTNYLQTCNILDNAPYFDEYFQFFPHNFNWEGCYHLDVQWWYHDDADTVIDFCRHWIKKRYYLDFDIWENELPGTFGYQRFHTTHQCLIYGFDDAKKELYSMCFDERFNFILIRHSYSNFQNAFRHVISYLNKSKQYLKEEYSLRIMKLTDYKYEFNHATLKTVFNEYLFSINSSENCYYSLYFEKKKYTAWGIDIINYLINYCKNTEGRLDYRAFHGLLEHKKIMHSRMVYLMKKSLVRTDDKIIEELKNLEFKADLIRSQIFRYNRSMSGDSLKKNLSWLEELYNNEKIVIPKIINLL